MKQLRKLSGATLKYIAFLSMFIDHFNKAIISPYLTGSGILVPISTLFDILGRIAFPLFAFFLVEGFFKTRNRGKYLCTLLIFGILSEVPFDMFTCAQFFNQNTNNVMFSLALALVTIWIIDTLKQKMESIPKIFWYFCSFVIVGIMCLVAMLLAVDYEEHAILMVYFLYIFRTRPAFSILFGYLSVYKEPWALLGLGLTLTYNGERGKQYKWLNYCFYPVHLFLLGVLRMYLGI